MKVLAKIFAVAADPIETYRSPRRIPNPWGVNGKPKTLTVADIHTTA